MDLKEMMVTNAQGSRGTANSDDGKYFPENDPYTFFASTDVATPGLPHKVKIVMPLGGLESGLFRFPKVGEKVLVGIEQTWEPQYTNIQVGGETVRVVTNMVHTPSNYYLMGYVPNTADQPFSPLKDENGNTIPDPTQAKVIDQQGQVFRYKKTGTNTSADKYSEIGFYNKKTAWKPNTVANDAPYPEIDHLNIQSTGDIHSNAQNYHEIKAKRLEILAGVPDSYDHTKDDDEFNWETTKLPLGDTPADDSHLYAGDAHIRANNRIVIKAGDEIVLQVGRSTLRITDAGITLSADKVKGGFANPWNTVLSLTPRDGITMFGQHLNMTGAFDFSLGDIMGGGLSSMAGVIRMKGKDIKASTLTNIGYIGKQAALSGQFGICVDAMRSGMLKRLQGDLGGWDTARNFASAIDKVFPVVSTVLEAALGKDTDPEDSDPIDFYMTVLGMLLSINAASCGILAEKMRTKQQLRDDIRDQINLSQVVVEYGLILAAAIPLAVGPNFLTGLTHSAALHLRGSAEIVQSGFEHSLSVLKQNKAFSPAAGYVHTGLNKVKSLGKGLWKDHKLLVTILGSITTVVASGSGVSAFIGGENSIKNRWDKTNAADKTVLDALKEL
jgi:hypothetical protein